MDTTITKLVYVFRYIKDSTPYGSWTIFATSEAVARIELAIKYNLGDTPLELVKTFPDRRREKERRES